MEADAADARLKPTLTLGELFGDGLLYSPRVSPNARAWIPDDTAVLDVLTGGQLTVLGNMPVLCAAAVAGPEALALLRDAGFAVPPETYQYRDEADYLRLLSRLGARGRGVVVQHVHPSSELAAGRCWVPPQALSFVNNKANLGELVDAPYRPLRRIAARDQLSSQLSTAELPVVLKAVSDESSGGGVDVLICRGSEDLGRAPAYFEACEQVVVEDYVEIRRNLCLNYAVAATGQTTYLGCAEQVSDAQGRYQGNWLDAESEAPALAVEVGLQIARAGFDRGYWGFVGIDMAVSEDGGIVVFDLNFRLNGCTAALVLASSVRNSLVQPVMRLRYLRGQGTYRELVNAIYAALGRGLLLPLATYDPAAGGRPSSPPLVNALIIGGSRDEVQERQDELAALGLE